MTTVVLRRFAYTPQGTFGVLEVNGGTWWSVERPWKDNERRLSCIPPRPTEFSSIYKLKLGYYHRGDYPAYELLDVPNRELIKIHIANTADDLMGCIGLGSRLGALHQRWAVMQARRSYNQFMDLMAGAEDAQLMIVNEWNAGLKAAHHG